MKNTKKEIVILSIILILQTLIYIVCGMKKTYIHMDEAYSLGLASYDKVEIQENTDFYNIWHDNKYYEDYLSVNDDEIGKYSQVYENQKNDVHPPLYYLILRFFMGFSKNHYSKWCGIIINIIIYIFITIFMYNILKKILEKKSNNIEKSAALAFISSITMASLTNVIYIRMYALATLNILVITFLHMKLIREKNINLRLLIMIAISALIGSLTHYYYLFYLAMMYIIFATKYIKEKEIKQWGAYTLALAIAGGISLSIFPYSIKHMFFGYRGQGVISKLLNVTEFLKNIGAYILKIDRFGFNNLLIPICLVILILCIYRKIKKKEDKVEKNEYIRLIIPPTIFYSILVAVSSPWVELRYIMPVCSLIFVIFIYYLYKLLNTLMTEKKSNIIISILLILILITPIFFKIEPEVMYSDKKEIVTSVQNELNVPTIFIFNSKNNRFLDDILLFSKIANSYIAKDMECTMENIRQIFRDKDISKGIVVFINEGQNNDKILEIISKGLELNEISYLKRMNACDTYYLK